MNNNKKIIWIAMLLVVLAFSFLMFFGFGLKEKTGTQISSFIFIIINELIIFENIIFLTNKKINNTFSIAGLSSLLFIYSICSLIFNIFFVNILNNLRINLILNFAILLIYIFIALVIFLFKKENK